MHSNKYAKLAVFVAATIAISIPTIASSLDWGINVWVSLDTALFKATPSMEIDDNIMVAEDILQGDVNPLFRKEKYFKAVKDFLRLKELRDPSTSINKGVGIIDKIERHSEDGLFHDFQRLGPVIRRAKEEFASVCYEKFIDSLEEVQSDLENMPEAKILRRAFEDALFIINRKQAIIPQHIDTNIIRVEDYSTIWHKPAILSLWGPCKELFPDIRRNKDRLKKCIVEPCLAFEEKLYDIFTPIEQVRLRPIPGRASEEKTKNFYITFGHYRMCTAFLEKGLAQMRKQISFMDDIDKNPSEGCPVGQWHKTSANFCES